MRLMFRTIPLVVSFCLFLVFSSFGQSKRRSSSQESYLKIQGAVSMVVVNSRSYSRFTVIPSKSVFSLHNVVLGFGRLDDRKYHEFTVSYMAFFSEDRTNSNALLSENTTRHFNLEYYRVLNKKKELDGLNFGVLTSVGLLYDKRRQFWLVPFTYRDFCYCIGIGPKVQCNVKLNKKTRLNISSQFNLLDVGLLHQTSNNTTIQESERSSSSLHADLIRNVFKINVGLII